MSIKLRDYQEKSFQETRGALREYRSVLLQLATGGGKTAIASAMTISAESKGNVVFFICHRVELIKQTALTFEKAGINYGIISSKHHFIPNKSVYICGIDTLRRRLDNKFIPTPKLVIWDEAHHCGAKTWGKLKAYYASAFHVGLSATPCRLDGRGLNEHFDYMTLGPTVSDLIKAGHLSDYDIYAPSQPDMSSVHRRMGDFVRSESEAVMDTNQIIGNVVGNWRKYANGKRTIGFAVSVKHSMHLAHAFNQSGVPAAHLDGNASELERTTIARKFAAGEIRVLFNVDLFGEGYDLAAQAGLPVTVDAVIQARPTQSLSLHLQQVGRALRPKSDGSNAVILDHAGNYTRHGLPDDDREWSLDGNSRQQGKAKPDASDSVRQCGECFYVHKPSPKCPACGHVYMGAGREVEEVSGELEKLDKDAARVALKKEQGAAQGLDALVELGKKRGYKNPHAWAAHVHTSRMRKRA